MAVLGMTAALLAFILFCFWQLAKYVVRDELKKAGFAQQLQEIRDEVKGKLKVELDVEPDGMTTITKVQEVNEE